MPQLKSDNVMTNSSATSSTVVEDHRAGEIFANPGKVKTVKANELTESVNYEELTELTALKDASIEAKPLMMPEGLNIKVKRHEYAYRWVAFKAHGGDNLDKFLYMGFQKATLDDVEPFSSRAKMNPDGIIVGDLLLMKMPKEIYFGQIKDNYRRANIAFTRGAEMAKLREAFPNGIPSASNGSPLLGFYKPADSDVASKLR